MKRHAIFMDWEAQHNKEVKCPQTDIQVNVIPIKIP